MTFVFAWLGFTFTVFGSFLLAFDRWQGFIAFIIANIFWGIVALATGQTALLAQMAVLMIPALLGVRNGSKK